MAGSYTARRVAAILRQHGEAMTLRRMPSTDVTVYGKRFGGGADQVAGAVAQATINVKISDAEIAAAGWPGPPRKGDKLIMSGRTYTLDADADTRADSGATLAHFLRVKG